jgi:hypothetical protein
MHFGWAAGGGAVHVELKGSIATDGKVTGTMSIVAADPTSPRADVPFVGTHQ